MFISHVSEEVNEVTGECEEGDNSSNHNFEFKTATELFELMAATQKYHEQESLSTRDVVLLYKNIDVGTKVLPDSCKLQRKPPNQYVETIVFEDFDSDSDLSEICSNDDIQNIVLINKERLDIFGRPSSIENSLCHKFGEIKINSTDFSYDFNATKALEERYMHEKLRSLNLHGLCSPRESSGSALPVSLIDYIRCKRLENNYNFHMDSIINYVNNTIDHLKRISNGDFLTETTKKQWRQVNNDANTENCGANNKALANSTSIPLYIEREPISVSSNWDQTFRSDIDIRSLSKIIEKKIIVEVPKALSGSYKIFSKHCKDKNIVIRCKKQIPALHDGIQKETKLDFMVKFDNSQPNLLTSAISSVIILQKSENTTGVLPLPYKEHMAIESIDRPGIEIQDPAKKCNGVTITELPDEDACPVKKSKSDLDHEFNLHDSKLELTKQSSEAYVDCMIKCEKLNENDGYNAYNAEDNNSIDLSNLEDGENYSLLPKGLGSFAKSNFSDNLKTFDMQMVAEEMNEESVSTIKRRSMSRNRIKSPYENKSHLIEEKKRKRLLEIKQRRERKKLAMAETFKTAKYKTPQQANSVTKLSISNKSFYHSIYGQNPNLELDEKFKLKIRRAKTDSIPEALSDFDDSVNYAKTQKYINKSFYLDNTISEMMYLDMNRPENAKESSENNSTNDLNNFNFSQFQLDYPQTSTEPDNLQHMMGTEKDTEDIGLVSQKSKEAPNNSTNNSATSQSECTGEGIKKSAASAEFRKSIDKIYELIHKRGKFDNNETKCKSKFTARADRAAASYPAPATSSIHNTDSGTSVKHQQQYSSNNSSEILIENMDSKSVLQIEDDKKHDKSSSPLMILPRVIISSKSQIHTENKLKPESPLNAISKLLEEFENVHKNIKSASEKMKKVAVSFADHQTVPKKGTKSENNDDSLEKPPKSSMPQARKRQPVQPKHPISPPEPKPTIKPVKKKVNDIVDEIKEARGEAVRGPSFKLNARLNSLAQPKKSYVQAQIEDFQARYGKSAVTDRLQRLTVTNSGPPQESTAYLKKKKLDTERLAGPPNKPTAPSQMPVLEKPGRGSFPTYVNRKSRSPVNTKQNLPFTDTAYSTIKRKLPVKLNATHAYKQSAPMSTTDTKGLSGVHVARAPLVPTDFDMSITGSIPSSILGDESAVIGDKIHYLIDTIISRSPDPMTSMTNDSIWRSNIEANKNIKAHADKSSNTLNVHENYANKQTEYDDAAVETMTDNFEEKRSEKNTKNNITSTSSNEGQASEVEVLENALCSCRSVGVFNKRLRLKNLTLAPKPPIQPIILLQSGDTKSLFSESVTVLNPELKTDLNWGFSTFPFQIATVGYAFPKYQNNLQHTANQGGDDVIVTVNRSEDDEPDIIQNPDITEALKTEHAVAQLEIKKLVAQVLRLGSFPDNGNLLKNIDKNNEIQSDLTTTIENHVRTVRDANEQTLSQRSSTSETHEISTITENCKIESDQTNIDQIACKNEVRNANVDYTASLDILVGLLNEIQNITSSQIVKSGENLTDDKHEQIVKTTRALDNIKQDALGHNLLSFDSLEKLRRLESDHSIYSLYLSNCSNCAGAINHFKPVYVDKEVNVSSQDNKELVNKCTDVPSIIFPFTVDNTTNVTNSVIGVISEPSNQSFNSFDEINLNRRHSLTVTNKIIELPQRCDNTRCVSSAPKTIVVCKHPKLHEPKCCVKCTQSPPDDESTKKISKYEVCIPKMVLANVKPKTKICKLIRKETVVLSRAKDNNLLQVGDTDPVLKMKRDILVTVYSVLVFTVFAALSFPEILYRT